MEQYLVFAEGQALHRIPMYMKDWIEKLHGFLKLNDRDILESITALSDSGLSYLHLCHAKQGTPIVIGNLK